MSRSFAAVLVLAFATALCAQDAAVPPLEGTVIHRLGSTNGRSAVELHDPAFSPAVSRTNHGVAAWFNARLPPGRG